MCRWRKDFQDDLRLMAHLWGKLGYDVQVEENLTGKVINIIINKSTLNKNQEMYEAIKMFALQQHNTSAVIVCACQDIRLILL